MRIHEGIVGTHHSSAFAKLSSNGLLLSLLPPEVVLEFLIYFNEYLLML